MSSIQPPEDPEYTSEPKVLSPVSPKPLHVPIPDNIPVLQMQIDPVFNQMDTHITDAPDRGDDALVENGKAASGQDQMPVEAALNGQAGQEALTGGPDNAPESVHATDVSAGIDLPPTAQALQEPATILSPSTAILPEGIDLAALLATKPIERHQDSRDGSAALPDYTALLNNIKLPTQSSASALDTNASFIPLDDAAPSNPSLSSTGNPSSAGLPPRPPHTQERANSNQFHPLPPHPGQLPPGAAYATNTNGLPPPPVASFQQPVSTAAQSSQLSPTQPHFDNSGLVPRDGRQAITGEFGMEDETPWTPDIKAAYDLFLEQEREYVTEGNWEQFPYGSRLFVGNLSSDRVTKRDVFHAFHKYGKLAQISIKQAYGFVQFLSAADCGRALDGEQGRIIRGKRINLEISKPQKNNRSNGGGGGRRRSRSPARQNGTDRYQPGGRQSDPVRRGRDDYRPARSPSPRGYRNRSRDRHGRYHSRSRSPRGRGGRYRSPSPRRAEVVDDLPLPRRTGRDVPDVQIIVAEELDRNFVQWVEGGIASRGIKVDVLLLSPRLSEAAVIKRQIVEGVIAVSRLTRVNQQTGKIPLQVFDRRGGSDVRFEEYADLDPNIAAEVVLRARANNQPAYGYGYSSNAPAAPSPAAFAPGSLPPHLSTAISTMDAGSLQKLLGSIQQPGQQTGLTPDLAKLLGSSGGQQQHGAYGQQQSGAQDPLAALRSNPAFAGLLGGQGGPPQHQQQPQHAASQQGGQGGTTNMADILAKLGSYRR